MKEIGGKLWLWMIYVSAIFVGQNIAIETTDAYGVLLIIKMFGITSDVKYNTRQKNSLAEATCKTLNLGSINFCEYSSTKFTLNSNSKRGNLRLSGRNMEVVNEKQDLAFATSYIAESFVKIKFKSSQEFSDHFGSENKAISSILFSQHLKQVLIDKDISFGGNWTISSIDVVASPRTENNSINHRRQISRLLQGISESPSATPTAVPTFAPTTAPSYFINSGSKFRQENSSKDEDKGGSIGYGVGGGMLLMCFVVCYGMNCCRGVKIYAEPQKKTKSIADRIAESKQAQQGHTQQGFSQQAQTQQPQTQQPQKSSDRSDANQTVPMDVEVADRGLDNGLVEEIQLMSYESQTTL